MANRKSNSENPMPIVDEGWWESVLAEEEHHASRPPVRQAIRPGAGAARAGAAGRLAPAGSQPERGTGEHGRSIRNEAKAEASDRLAPDWVQVKDLYLHDQIVNLHVTGCNRGGLLVEGEDLYGFVPFSHLIEMSGLEIPDREKYLESYIGRTLKLKIIECVPEDGRIVFSERAAQAEPGKRAELFHSLHAGERVKGVVTNVTDFGAFIDLGGVEGLIHISELSWGRVVHPSQILQLGQTVEVQVLDLSPERCRVALSLKRLCPNPWLQFGPELTVGQVLPAAITSILSYGAFARLEIGIEGLIHASEMPLETGQAVKDFLHEGQTVQVCILHVDAKHQRMGLSLKLEA